MQLLRLKFPLIREVTAKLPEGSDIQAVSIQGDISFLECAVPNDYNDKPEDVAKWRNHVILTYLEGEKGPETRAEDGRLVPGALIEVPRPSESLRLLGTLKTLETPATWHVFEKLTPGKA